MTRRLLAALFLVLAVQGRGNVDESLAGDLPLPQALVCADGTAVTRAETWTAKRRPELIALFEQNVYGQVPGNLGKPKFTLIQEKTDALGGLATRKLINLTLPDHPAWPGMQVMVYLPNNAATPSPCFVGLSFGGNQAVSAEPDIPLTTRWMPAAKGGSVIDHRATEKSRGSEASRWPVEKILGAGFAVATAYYGDLEPDAPDGWKTGLRAAVSPDGPTTIWRNGDWGAIATWAWGLSRILDFLETDTRIDAKHCAVIGHSRLGKSAAWAGALDSRFAMVIANNSGEGGAALMRRDFGETTASITRVFPHWFTPTYKSFANNPAACPVDQHLLLALVAPRPLSLGCAENDQWGDPKGEFLAALAATPVYQLLATRGLATTTFPPLNSPVGDTLRFHLRSGPHELLDFDWAEYLSTATKALKPVR
jgi:hypothetical protein